MARIGRIGGVQPMASLDSAIIWQGPSRFDGAPLVAIVTGLAKQSRNPKTGPLAQLWILRGKVNPLEAAADRRDYSICGNCKLRGDSEVPRACYVSLVHAPLAVYKRYRRGGYRQVEPAAVNKLLAAKDRGVRLGAYGDPAAIPVWVLAELTAGIRHTGYTHQWRDQLAYRPYLMASCDTPAEYAQARQAGWRTFRTRMPGEELHTGEIACPASAEAGYRTTCDRCTLCDGTRGEADKRRGIAIMAHGVGTGNYIRLREVARA